MNLFREDIYYLIAVIVVITSFSNIKSRHTTAILRSTLFLFW